MNIRKARLAEENALNALCWRSKKHWGYDDTFMANAVGELTVDTALIERELVLVAEVNGVLAGVVALEPEDADTLDVAVFFVEPDLIGTGIGAALFKVMLTLAGDFGARRITILSDPNAEDFYVRMGAKRIGEQKSSSATGRILPFLEVVL